jgi:hypothetical protein
MAIHLAARGFSHGGERRQLSVAKGPPQRIHPARVAGKVETTWAFPAAAAPLLRLVLGPVPVDEIAWILFRRTWVEPRT